MSGPHVTGLIGLIWSAAPVFEGDIAETYDIINDTAIPLTGEGGSGCGGDYDVGPNNDWGFGTIDALAAVNEALVRSGPSGALQGTVTDSVSGLPLADVAIEAVGPFTRTTATDGAGAYSFALLPIGDYDVTASIYGYGIETVTATVLEGQTTVLDFALDPLPAATVSGVVSDGSGHGWPLYAQIDVSALDFATTIFTDPATVDLSRR